jgi:hypothetical protein
MAFSEVSGAGDRKEQVLPKLRRQRYTTIQRTASNLGAKETHLQGSSLPEDPQQALAPVSLQLKSLFLKVHKPN